MQKQQSTPARPATRRKIRCAALALMLSMTSCAGIGSADSFCAAARPILVADDDVLTAELVARLLEHNRTGRKLCGW